MRLSIKAKRNIGLIAVTIAIVVAIILVVYFVQKNEDNGKLKTGAIGQVVSTSQADICVKDMRILQSIDGLTAGDGKCFLLLSVELKANKKINVLSDKFEVKGGKNVMSEWRQEISSGATMEDVIANGGELFKAGREETFNLLYEVEYNRAESYFLYAYGARIDLGGTIPVQMKMLGCTRIATTSF